MTARAFRQVDVFTDHPGLGNPVAVVHDAEGLTTEQMQAFTDWTNLSEATFLLPPTDAEADYRVRIFCPGRELPFAGHPTLGTAHAWLEAGGVPAGAEVVQECGVGLVRIRRDGGRLHFLAPPLRRFGPLGESDVSVIARGLGLDRAEIIAHQWCDNGPGWQAVLLESADRVLSLTPDPALLAGRDVGVAGPRTGGDADDRTDLEVRAFFPGNSGVTEDPVTGSLNAALAQWLIPAGLMPAEYIAAQGTAMNRAGRVHVQAGPEGAIWVGGSSVTVIDGTVAIGALDA